MSCREVFTGLRRVHADYAEAIQNALFCRERLFATFANKLDWAGQPIVRFCTHLPIRTVDIARDAVNIPLWA